MPPNVPVPAHDPPRVVVADPDASVRAAIARRLTAAGCLAVEVADGRQALDELRDRPPVVLVTDLALDVVGGLDVLRIRREQQMAPSCRVIVHSGRNQTLYVQQARRLGSHRFLDRRPDDLGPLVDAVHGQLAEVGIAATSPGGADPVAADDRSRLLGAFGTGGGPPGRVPPLSRSGAAATFSTPS